MSTSFLHPSDKQYHSFIPFYLRNKLDIVGDMPLSRLLLKCNLGELSSVLLECVKCSHPTTDSQQGTREGFLVGRAIWTGPCNEEGLLGWEMVEGPPEGSDPWRELSSGL